MKLIIAIIQNEYMLRINKVLMDNKIRITKLSSTGGFLKAGNTTVLIGVEDSEVERVIDIIKNECNKSKAKSSSKEEAKAANLFVIDVDQFVRI